MYIRFVEKNYGPQALTEPIISQFIYDQVRACSFASVRFFVQRLGKRGFTN